MTVKQHYRRSPKESDVRGTPPELYRELTERFDPCDLDVCALPSNAKCERFYSETGGYEKKTDGRIVQVLGQDGTSRGLLGVDGLPLAERLRTFCSVEEAQQALLAGASFDVPVGLRRHSGRDDGVPHVRQPELRGTAPPVSGDSVGQHEGLFGQGAFGGALYARAQADYALAPEARGGLACPWVGSVWANPPFSQCGNWTAKARAEISDPASECRSVLMLLPNNKGEQAFWHRDVEPFRDESALRMNRLPYVLTTHNIRGRRKFLDEHGNPIPGSPPFGLVVLHWRRI